MEFTEACRKIISLDSSPGNGNLHVAEFVAELCREQGLHVKLQKSEIASTQQANVIVRPGPSPPPLELLFQTHLDTADPGSYKKSAMGGSTLLFGLLSDYFLFLLFKRDLYFYSSHAVTRIYEM